MVMRYSIILSKKKSSLHLPIREQIKKQTLLGSDAVLGQFIEEVEVVSDTVIRMCGCMFTCNYTFLQHSVCDLWCYLHEERGVKINLIGI